jgi:hypothetical protein
VAPRTLGGQDFLQEHMPVVKVAFNDGPHRPAARFPGKNGADGWFLKSCTKQSLTVKENLKLRSENEGCKQRQAIN